MNNYKRSGGNRRDSGRSFSKRSSGGFGGRPEMFKTICDECGRPCEVPFKPSGNKKVYCSDCFERQENQGSGRFDESYGNRPGRGSAYRERRFSDDRSSKATFTAVCDECGKSCQLPFKPTSNKPVYCSDCFEMRGERSGLQNNKSDKPCTDTAREYREIKDQLVSLNLKLEQLSKALGIKPEKKSAPKVVKVSKAEFDIALADEVPAAVTEDAIIDTDTDAAAEDVTVEVVTEKKATKEKTVKATKTAKATKAKKAVKADKADK